jgi:hypothetical protein
MTKTPENRPQRRARKPKPGKTDEKGVPLTPRQRSFPILPSDLHPAFQAGPKVPKHGYLPEEFQPITTSIPELNAIEWTERLHHAVIDAIQRADKVQIEKLNPHGGPNLRYRVELAAAFLAHVMSHAYDAAEATGAMKPDDFVALGINLVVRRAQEIYGQAGG